jgi:hypothetical protein
MGSMPHIIHAVGIVNGLVAQADFQASQTAKACSGRRVQSLLHKDKTTNPQLVNEAI